VVYVLASLVLAVVRLCHRLVCWLEDMRRQAHLITLLVSRFRRAAGLADPDEVAWKQSDGACFARPVGCGSGLEAEK